jgi:hypothetical protein
MGVTNPPANLPTTAGPPQVAIADTATLISTAGLQPMLQATLTAQGFSNANNWYMVGNAAPLDNTAVFTVSTYSLSLNPVNADYPVAGVAFGEMMRFSFTPNLAQPMIPMGSIATLHWLQLLNESSTFATMEGGTGFGYPIAGQPGYWQLDNGDKPGTTAAGAALGAANGPYYDSNGGPTGATQTVPNFYDFPNYYSGYGTYLHFDAIPTWDVYTPATAMTPATDTIDIGNYAVAWGFTVVPEPAVGMCVIIAAVGAGCLSRRRTTITVPLAVSAVG